MNDSSERMANVHNPFQTRAKRVLCVCSAGMLRSATAANVLHKEYGYNTRAVGIAEYALIPVDDVLIAWADEIICMGEEHLRPLLRKLPPLTVTPVFCLRLPDIYPWMDPKLQELISTRYKEKEKWAVKSDSI